MPPTAASSSTGCTAHTDVCIVDADSPALKDAAAHKNICIVGAGPAGLTALKAVLEAPQCKRGLWSVVAYEARTDVGGIWNPDSPPSADPPLTPLYDSLATNLPHPLMAFKSLAFPPSTPLYPDAHTVHAYLQSYADHFSLRPHIRLGSTVTSVEYTAPHWTVCTSAPETRVFDLVVVCNGRHRVLRYPNVPGLAAWLNEGRATHSAWYRHPLPGDVDATVLVVGGGPSGQDITNELGNVARWVIHSVPGTTHTESTNIKLRGRVTGFTENGVLFEDGAHEEGITRVILATGYEASFPFSPPSCSTDPRTPIQASPAPPALPPLPRELQITSYGAFFLAEQLFPLQAHFDPTTLAFLSLAKRVVPFPLMEAQARAVVRAFGDPCALDVVCGAAAVVQRYETLRAKLQVPPGAGGDCMHEREMIGKAWFTFEEEGEQFEYRDRMNEFAEGAESGGPCVRVCAWEREMYSKKVVLRRAWQEIEARGEAEEWVGGVGEGGMEEWVELMRRVLKRGEAF